MKHMNMNMNMNRAPNSHSVSMHVCRVHQHPRVAVGPEGEGGCVRCGNPERGEEMPSRISDHGMCCTRRARAIGDTVIAFSPTSTTAHAAPKQVLLLLVRF